MLLAGLRRVWETFEITSNPRAHALARENAKLAEALRRHEQWCGHNPEAPGDSIINDPVVRRAIEGKPCR